MINGIVNDFGEPIVKIILQTKKKTKVVNAVIDTGFNGYLSIPRFYIKETNWDFVGNEEYELASGELLSAEVYLGNVKFDGPMSTIYILVSGTSDVLIGTELLKGKLLLINFKKKSVKIKNA